MGKTRDFFKKIGNTKRTFHVQMGTIKNRNGKDLKDILECEVKWAIASITPIKARGVNGILTELFQILKMMLLKCCTEYISKFEKLSSGHRTEKGQVSV